MKTIGVLGGMGPQATMDFETRVHRVSQMLIPRNSVHGYPPMIVAYFRQIPVLMPADGSRPVGPPPIRPDLLELAAWLGNRADFLVITSNGVHNWRREIEQAARRPVVSMVEATIADVQRRGCRRVGILDFHPAAFGLHNRRLDEPGIAWEAVPDETLPGLERAVHAVDEGSAGPAECTLAQDGIGYLRARQVDCLIPACTELPLLLGPSMDAADMLNPAQFLAEASVRYALA